MSIKHYDDFNPLIDFDKLAEVIQNDKKLFDIAKDKEEADLMKAELNMKGFVVSLEPFENGFRVFVIPGEIVDYREAIESGMFQKLAWGHYTFIKRSDYNNGKYNFDDGSIWKIITDEDGKEFLAKEVDDTTEAVIRVKK